MLDIYRVHIASDNEIVRHARANPRSTKQYHGVPRNTSSTLGFHSGIAQYRPRQKMLNAETHCCMLETFFVA